MKSNQRRLNRQVQQHVSYHWTYLLNTLICRVRLKDLVVGIAAKANSSFAQEGNHMGDHVGVKTDVFVCGW
jgi:hypothetical protein